MWGFSPAPTVTGRHSGTRGFPGAVSLIREMIHVTEDLAIDESELAGNRISDDGIVTIEANRFRSQKRNREDALERLVELLRRAAEKPKERRRTKPTAGATRRRLEDKRHRSAVKDKRRPPIHDED